MVDVLSARLQDVYTKWESRSEPRLLNQTSAPHLSYGGLRRYGYQERHRKRALAREVSREFKLRDLLEIKEEPWKLDLNKETRPFMGLCCNSCTSNSRKKLSSALFWDIMRCRAVITTQHGIISQKSADLINFAAEA